jgi:hypothetical protein
MSGNKRPSGSAASAAYPRPGAACGLKLRLPWEPGRSHDILAAYIRVPELSTERVGQRYSLLGSDAAGCQRFEYLLPAQPSSLSGTTRQFEYHSA